MSIFVQRFKGIMAMFSPPTLATLQGLHCLSNSVETVSLSAVTILGLLRYHHYQIQPALQYNSAGTTPLMTVNYNSVFLDWLTRSLRIPPINTNAYIASLYHTIKNSNRPEQLPVCHITKIIDCILDNGVCGVWWTEDQLKVYH